MLLRLKNKTVYLTETFTHYIDKYVIIAIDMKLIKSLIIIKLIIFLKIK